jgi:hypothetical protein
MILFSMPPTFYFANINPSSSFANMKQVIDHYTFDRKIVSIGMHFFVRYTSLTTKKDYVKLELATATSLYLAMKLFGPKLSRNDNLLLNFVRMSNSRFNETQIVEMEMKMLNTFSWYVNPIVPQDFITYFVRILSHINPSLDKSAQTKLIELSIYVIELIVFTPQFMDDKPSSLACAAMAIALKQGVKATTSSIHYENDLDCLFPLFDYGFVNCSTIRDLSNQIISYLQQVSPIFDDIHFGNDPVHGMVYERVFPWEEKEKVHKCNNQAIATTCACSNMQHREENIEYCNIILIKEEET